MARKVELDERIIKKNKIPILIKDNGWESLFKKNQTRDMERLGDKLEELINEERETMRLLKESRKEKRKLMNKVLKLSDEANSNNDATALVQLENTRNKILKISEKIDELQFKLEILPKEIYNTNFELLKKTIVISYEDIKEGRQRVDYLDLEIQKLREILGKMWEEKFTREKRINDLYLYLHGTLGHEEIDKLDKRFL